MNTIRGAIASLKENKTSKGRDRYEIMLSGKRLSKLGHCPFKVGDLVEVDYEEMNGFNNIQFIRKSLAKPSPILPAPSDTPKVHMEADAGLPTTKVTSIERQSCIRSDCIHYACILFQGKEVPMVTITAYAQFFLDWIEKKEG